MGSLVTALIAIVLGVGGGVVLFWGLNALVERLPKRWEQLLKPYVFIGPAMVVVGAFLLYPAIQTLIDSFKGPSSEEFVGFENYQYLVTDPAVREAMFNNILWIIFVPTLSVAAGLAIATLADRLRPRSESVAKSLIFLPMAISFVGASTIWGFIYAWRPAGRPQIGLLNAIVTGLGFDPVTWLQTSPINDYALMIIMVWLQSGFAMVLLSAAIKAVPEDTIEAARIDGATELQIFWRVVVPQILPTVAVVTTTILILVLKVFDIVRVLTGGNFGTDIIANLFITQLITFRQFGQAAVIVVALIIATIPVMIWNIRRFREQEATR